MNFVPIPKHLLDKGYTFHSLEVNHKKPGNKHLNNASNLEWATSSENKKHDYNIGIRPFGSKNRLNISYTESQIHNVCKLLESNNYSIPEISNMTGVCTQVVYDILYGGSWTSISTKYNVSNYTPKNSKYDKNTIDMILNMYHDGISRIEISKSLKIDYKSICYIINKHK